MTTRLIAFILAAMGGIAATLIDSTAASAYSGPAVPEGLKAPADQTVSLVAHATGVQIYECGVSKTDPAKFEWTFKAPEADLFDSAGKKIGKHYAGPSWESSDASKVVGEVTAKNDAPDASAIPWLLLKAKSTSGSGVFGKTQSIQRVNTVGGTAPAQGCGDDQLGKEARIPYKATYYFYAPKP
jgi:Protein of unknown function (DUF3455)